MFLGLQTFISVYSAYLSILSREKGSTPHPRSLSYIEKLQEGLGFPKTFFHKKKEIISTKMHLERLVFLEILTFYHFEFLIYLHILDGIKLFKKILTESSNKNNKKCFYLGI